MHIRPMTQDDIPLIQEWLRSGMIGSEVTWRLPNMAMMTTVGMIEVDRLPVGSVVLYNVDRQNLCAEIGVYIADTEYRSTGIGPRAMRQMMRRAFDKLGLERIEAQVLSKNKAVNELARRAGFVKEGARRKAALVDGKREHVVIWSMLRSEFDRRWRR